MELTTNFSKRFDDHGNKNILKIQNQLMPFSLVRNATVKKYCKSDMNNSLKIGTTADQAENLKELIK